jgi:signal peptidase I
MFAIDWMAIIGILACLSWLIIQVNRYCPCLKKSGRWYHAVWSWMVHHAQGWCLVLWVCLFLRLFVGQLFRVPTGSLEPTVVPGDILAVEQISYGIHIPWIYTTLWAPHHPKRGDVVVFHYPLQPSVFFVKRIVGVAGDVIRYDDKQLTINGVAVTQRFVKKVQSNDRTWLWFQSTIDHKTHLIQHDANMLSTTDGMWYIPKGSYFAMGDNRDNSGDSRFWGLVEEKYIVGHAMCVILNINSHYPFIHLDRIGHKL